MKDYLELGPVPTEEPCQQVGTPEYDAVAARGECKRFAAQLGAMFGRPERFVIRPNPHDFGVYYEVAVCFDTDDADETEFAFRVEGDLPAFWSDTRERSAT